MIKIKKKTVYQSVRKPIPPVGGPMKSKKQKAKEKRMKGKALLAKIEKGYS
ncbi:MAG: hypothetical protein HY445_00675 [Candidatus Niyogibacteria bacterium]|nr:hypothetical protein [Candidatus Niyogibacteria bacterium]